MIRRLFRLLFHRNVFILLGILALVLLIWYAGPLFAFADWRPLGPPRVRAWLIAILLLGLLLRYVIVPWWRRKRVNARLIDAVLGLRGRDEAEVHDPAAEAVEDLRGSFRTAMEKLRKARFDGGSSWWSRWNHTYLYQMPWYVFIGAPGSGKTTALVNSGLRFPLAEDLGQGHVRGIGGTRRCDWWFSAEAVLLDTAGRYTTQESDAAGDKAEWESFLGLLKKFRPRQPLNGVVLTLSVADLLSASEAERRMHIRHLSARLHELTDNLGISLPVYVLVTKVDLLGGFNEYFHDLDREERAQVWGTTLPFEPGVARDGEVLQGRLEGELQALVSRLFEHQPEFMLDEKDASRRARAYVLPQHFKNLCDVVRGIVSEVFSDRRLSSTALLRGVYFTSGTQEGLPFDQLMHSLADAIGIDANVAVQPTEGSGKSYFLADLLRHVIFPEAYLAGHNRRRERRRLLASIAGHCAVLLLLGGLLAAWVGSYHNNTRYLEQVDAKAAVLETELGEIARSSGSSLLARLPVLTDLRWLADGATFRVDTPPWSYRWGLYQGFKIDSAAQNTYRQALDRIMLPQVVGEVEGLLRDAPDDNLELAYEALKGYLMLNEPEHYRRDGVEALIQLAWDAGLPPSTSREQRTELDEHLHALLSRGLVISPLPANTALVAAARDRLASYSPAQRAYSRLKKKLLQEPRQEFTIARTGGPQAGLIFARTSGEPLTRGVPGLFTRDGYYDLFLPETRAVVKMLEADDSWVLGDVPATAKEQLKANIQGDLSRDVRTLYLHEYVRRWQAYLDDIRLVNMKTMTESMEAARVLAAPDSPIVMFLKAAARETTLLQQDTTDGTASLLNRTKQRVAATRQDLERVVGSTAALTPGYRSEKLERIVDDAFAPLHELARSNGGTSQLDEARRLFNELYMDLSSSAAAMRSHATTTPDPQTINRIRAQAASLPNPLRRVVDNLASTGSAQTDGGMRRTLSGVLETEVGTFCRAAIAGRYPFSRAASKDVTWSDFARMFAPGGLMDRFFQQRLEPWADLSGGTWVMRQPGGATVSLSSFQKAARIRDVFFPSGGNRAQLAFDVQVLEMDASILRLTVDFDGNSFQYAHGPQIPHQINWPGSRGNEQVRLVITDGGGNDVTLVKEGPWAPFRLFDEGEARMDGGPERFVVTFFLQGKKVVLGVTSSSVRNPFRLSELKSFSCPRGL